MGVADDVMLPWLILVQNYDLSYEFSMKVRDGKMTLQALMKKSKLWKATERCRRSVFAEFILRLKEEGVQ